MKKTSIILGKNTKFKNIFFDFDGVIAESVSAKTEAFRDLYLPYGKSIADKVELHHTRHGGVSRYEKFKIYHEEFLNTPISQDGIEELAQQFSDLVLNKVINSDEVKGAEYFIKKYASKLKYWIITGTPTTEIKVITDKRNLTDYFIGIHGSPKNKKYWTEYLIGKHQLKREETLFLGDATTDYDAALFSNLHFALRENEENEYLFKDYHGLKFIDFYQLEKSIKNHLTHNN
ncbi:HAD family hydrolase [Ichthyenterobacterium sp. W332]|uniref:phosphoglycolate phosphatase n=1 Tax=Microcosmobacter mediterraneus TaxID=3075607 RepID=A0ABU2YK42_9FLAO|nr:HAD family hydrolase [Ichthyenterobacterium sp. W332]MDT0558059.1 HAD family hydrolase [Ichthyenterobacterium sp. W332]